jgi:hypothetical protein
MKRFLTTTFIILALATSIVSVMSVGAHIVHAANAPAAAADGGASGNPNILSSADTGNVMGSVMTWFVSLFAELVGIAMIALNYAMYYTVLNMGNYVSHLSAIGVTWRILRDLGNIMLIFGFLAVGITTILNVNWYGGGKKMLPTLLIVAVFLNFSLFISEAVIDAGNLFATQFYTQISGGPGNLPTAATLNNEGISDTIMSQFGLAQFYGGVTKNPDSLLHNAPWYTGFLMIILFLTLAFVLFALAFILIARFVVLILLIIVAPIGFAGLVVPKLDNTAQKWWSTLFEQTITAPVLLLLLYIALAVITDANFLTGFSSGNNAAAQSAGWLGLATGQIGGFASVFLPFLVGMGLLVAVVMVSKRMSAFGGGVATKWAGALTFGATGWAMNRTVGRAAYYASRGIRQNKTLNKINAATGRLATRGFDRVGTASFDVRGTGVLKTADINAGTVAKDGFAGARTRSIKDHKEEVKKIEEAYKDKGSDRFIPKIKADNAEAFRKAQQEEATAKKAKEEAQARLIRLNSIVDGSPEHEIALDEAENKLRSAESDLARVVKKRADAETATMLTETELKSAADTRMGAEIKKGKTAYAEGISKWYAQPIGLFAYGPSSGAATRKIKESLKDKSPDAKLAEAVREAAKIAEPATGTTDDAKPKDEAPTPAAEPHA